MPVEIAFWDTSAIIPLYCSQAISQEARRMRRRFKEPVVWWGTHVEVYSAINRLRRDGLLTDDQQQTALEKWHRLRSRSRHIGPNDKVLSIAVSLTSEHNIRALDAFQLAAALIWCSDRPRNRPFITADTRLGKAASDAGFNVVSLA